MFALIALGFGLSIDNFRTSVVLGGLKPSLRQSAKTSLIFGLWDGVAPLVGMLIGAFLSTRISNTADLIAAVGLGSYGLFVIYKAFTSPESADPDLKTARRWLPVPLSVDNVLGGAAIGLAGYSPWVAPILFAFTTFVVSLAGHQVGRMVAQFIPRLRTDLLTGFAFVLMAGMVVVGVGDF
ncbi:MAG TPA: manganese efflux pump [Flexivirga sp.]|uniref:manganese efflux pump MntP n=1 Tax=Flexivirga sp. TaxID=1962927 RepID=UPI002B60798E|nr:manganese efflux pump [Flexivirga sp.]HWC22986.1 manganese efflux pump [Flexivirga sp.]